MPIVTERSIVEDKKIIGLLFERAETVLDEISNKYSRLYKGILREVLSDECDVEECGNDVLLTIWNTIPPNRPKSMTAYICKVARHIGIDKLRYNTRKKRDAGYTVMLSELEDCLPADQNIHGTEEHSEIIRSILDEFLRGLDPETEIMFVRRYIYLESVTHMAKQFELDENHISVKLYRARKKLKKLLEKEGIKI